MLSIWNGRKKSLTQSIKFNDIKNIPIYLLKMICTVSV